MGICSDKDEKVPFQIGGRMDTSSLKKKQTIIIFLIGGPGVGKSTLGKKLAVKYKFVLIWLSNILREEVEMGSERGEYFKAFMIKGEIVPPVIIVQLVLQKMLAHPNAFGYLVVGFPRDKKQAVLFNTEVRPPTLVLNLYARRVTLQDRLVQRASIDMRFDDNAEAMCNRVIKYYTNVKSAIAPNKDLTKVIDAENSIEDVYNEACLIINQTLGEIF